MKLLQEILFSYAKVQLFDTGIVRLDISGAVTVGVKQARELNDAIGILSKGEQKLVVMLADEIAVFEQEVLEFSASPEGQSYTFADALVVKSLKQRLLANMYLRIFKPVKPSRIFNSEKKAIKWLYSLEKSFVPA